MNAEDNFFGQVMMLNYYQETSGKHAFYPGKDSTLGVLYCSLKLAGEAGEVAEKLGKLIRDSHLLTPAAETGLIKACSLTPAERESMAAELGDVLWYVSRLARELGFSLEDIAWRNLEKLESRAARGTLAGSGDDR